MEYRTVTVERSPRSTIYDGRFYGRIVDPMLRGLHSVIAKQVAEGSRVLDAGCGTGGLAMKLASRCSELVGVDLSPKNIAFAEGRCRKLGLENVRFEVGDCSNLARYDDDAFDVVTCAMVIHEMPTEPRVPVLRELARVGREVIAVDFASPMPRNLAGFRNRFIELTAGREHFGAFRDYTRRGGLGPLVEEAGLAVKWERLTDSKTTVMMALKRGEP